MDMRCRFATRVKIALLLQKTPCILFAKMKRGIGLPILKGILATTFAWLVNLETLNYADSVKALSYGEWNASTGWGIQMFSSAGFVDHKNTHANF